MRIVFQGVEQVLENLPFDAFDVVNINTDQFIVVGLRSLDTIFHIRGVVRLGRNQT